MVWLTLLKYTDVSEQSFISLSFIWSLYKEVPDNQPFCIM